MSNMRRIRKPIIKLGRVRSDSRIVPRVGGDSRQILQRLSPRSQRVLVKVRQSYANSSGAWKHHGRYLERDSARFGDGFSAGEDKVDIPKTLDRWQRAEDEKLHKIILSPEYAERVDLKAHTRELMTEVEHDLGRPLEWVGIVHKNTDYHHLHIALRGLDGNGQSLDIEEYLGSAFRERSREILTRRMGPRLYPDILERREREILYERLTDIDRSLLWKADENNLVTIPYPKGSDWKGDKLREQDRTRLIFLEELGLAERIGSDRWVLSDNMRESLRRLSLMDQLVKEKVPGWNFVRTLRKSGVVRKRLELGESLTGRVVGTDILDPFGDRAFMLLEATDGVTYHINQPRGAAVAKVAANDVITLERRSIEVSGEDGETPKVREFTAVQVHPNWQKSHVLDREAAETLRVAGDSVESLNRVGFAKAWHDSVRSRITELRSRGFDPDSRTWESELEAIRFSEVDPQAWKWNPRDYLRLEGDDSHESLQRVSERDRNRFVVGTVIATSEHHLVVRDVRDDIGRVIKLDDVGLTWAPSVGSTVSIAAKTLPRTDLRPTDERIAELLTRSQSFSPFSIGDDEGRFVVARANTWVRWKLLTQDEDGTFRLNSHESYDSKEAIVERMEERLDEVRAELRDAARKQPAWLQFLEEDKIALNTERFVTLDRLLRDLGAVPERENGTWLNRALTWRKELWEKREIQLGEQFEQNARLWLRDKLLPTTLSDGQTVTGRLVNLDVGDGRYFAVDGSDGRLHHFRISDKIREKIADYMLELGDVVTLTGRSFQKTSNGTRRIHYLDVHRHIDWSTSANFLREAFSAAKGPERELQEESFAIEWKAEAKKLRERNSAQTGLEIRETRLGSKEELTGKVILLEADDGERILLEGMDGSLHLTKQTKRIRDAISARSLKLGDVATLVSKEFSADGRNISYLELIRHENWQTSLALEKFALTHTPDEIAISNGRLKSDFAKEWRREAAKRRAFLDKHGVSLEALEKGEQQGLSERNSERLFPKAGTFGTDRSLIEVPIGQPLSGRVIEIVYRADGEKPYFVTLENAQGELVHLKASRGVSRAVIDGRIQRGDQVTLSTREFMRDGKTLYYTEVNHEDIRRKTFRDKEVFFGKVLSGEIKNERYLFLDSPEGRVLARISQAIKNQVKEGRIRVGDVVVLSSERISAAGAKLNRPVLRLRAKIADRWEETADFDRAVIRLSRAGVIDEYLSKEERGFRRQWNEAVEARSKELLEAGVSTADNWEEKLSKFRQREHRERLTKPPTLEKIRSHDLEQLPRLEVLFRQATDAGWFVRSEANALNFVAAAARAQRTRGDSARAFRQIVRAANWRQISQKDEDSARRQLIAYRERVVGGFSVEPTVDRGILAERTRIENRLDDGRS